MHCTEKAHNSSQRENHADHNTEQTTGLERKNIWCTEMDENDDAQDL